MSPPTDKAVFLSYASQDAEAARRICLALRAAGVVVWFDQNELVGGDAWDAKIRRQIASCALFVPVISANTQARLEGYFRIEWKLAAQRTHAMADEKAFLLPVVIDATRDAEASVPAEFKTVQWTRSIDGETNAGFCTRVQALLAGTDPRFGKGPVGSNESLPSPAARSSRPIWRFAAIAAIAAAAVGLLIWQPWRSVAPEAVGAAKRGDRPDLARVRQLANFDRSSREDLALALALTRRVTTVQPDDAIAWAWESITLSLQDIRGYDSTSTTLREARQSAERALSIQPDSADAALAMGLHLVSMLSRGGDAVAAEGYLKRATKAGGTELVQIGLALLWREAWRLDDLAAEAESVLAQNPDHKLAAYLLGGARAWQRRPDEGTRWREAAESAPGLLGIRAAVGHGYIKFYAYGDVAGMRRALEAIPPAARLDPRAIVALWHAAYWERRGDAAMQVLGTLPDAWIADSYFHGPKALLVGLAHRLAGRHEVAKIQWLEAERLVRERLQRDVDDDALRLRLAEVLALQGRADEARRELTTAEAALAVRPISIFRVLRRNSAARVIAELGEIEPLLPYLEELLLQPNVTPYTPTSFAMDPVWDRVRDDPRVQSILRRAGELNAGPGRDRNRTPRP